MGITAAIVGGTALIGSYMQYEAAQDSADATEQAAIAQQSAAREQLEFDKQKMAMAQQAALPNYEEMAAKKRLLDSRNMFLNQQMGYLQKEQVLLDSVDPALREAGEQAYKLMKGEEAAVLGPIRKQRDRQRIVVENELASRLGSGFRTSSAGIEAMRRFDDETDTLMASAQFTTLNNLLGVSAQVRPDMIGKGHAVANTISGFDTAMLAGEQNEAARRVSAITGSNVNYQNVVNTAGAQYAGDILQAQSEANFWGNLSGLAMNIGGTAAGAYAGDYFGQMGQNDANAIVTKGNQGLTLGSLGEGPTPNYGINNSGR